MALITGGLGGLGVLATCAPGCGASFSAVSGSQKASNGSREARSRVNLGSI